MAAQISKLIGKMRENTLFLKDINRRLVVICGQIKDAAGRFDTEMIAEAMPGMNEELIKMREMLNEFKV